MNAELPENTAESTFPSANNEPADADTGEDNAVAQKQQDVPERLERVEAALGLVLDHLQTVTKGTEIIDAEHTRSLLSSIALGISAVALIALWSIAISLPDIAADILRFSIGMSLLFLAAVVDLASVPFLRKAINRATLEKDPSRLLLGQDSWYRVFSLNYWKEIKKDSSDFYHYQLVRCFALLFYLLAGAFLIWAVFSL